MRTCMILPINLIENRANLNVVIGFHLGEAPSFRDGTNLGSKEIVHALSRGAIQELIGGMLI